MVTSLSSLTAVILNWNTPGLTIRSARALLADGLPAERIVVVDNGSSDDSAARFQDELPACRLVLLGSNKGSCLGNNIGATALEGALYLFVNSDAFVHRPGTVRALVAAFDEESVGIAVPRLLNPDLTLQPSVVPIHSPAVAFMRGTGLERLVPNDRQPDWGTKWDHRVSRDVQTASGAVMLIRKRLWDESGGFDTKRHMYGEDLDLCWRARRLGWKIRFVAEAEFIHIGRGSVRSRWSDVKRAATIGRAESAMIKEYLGPVSASVTIVLMASGAGARWVLHTVRGSREVAAELGGSVRGLLQGLFDQPPRASS